MKVGKDGVYEELRVHCNRGSLDESVRSWYLIPRKIKYAFIGLDDPDFERKILKYSLLLQVELVPVLCGGGSCC